MLFARTGEAPDDCDPSLEIRLIGPFEVVADGHPVDVRQPPETDGVEPAADQARRETAQILAKFAR
jgi:hypothetical protein